MDAPKKATIDWDGYELIVKFSPFNPKVVGELKETIPFTSRSWSRTESAWRIATNYLGALLEIFDLYDYAVRDYTGSDAKARERQANLREEREAARATRDKADADRAAREEAHDRERSDYFRRFELGENDPSYWYTEDDTEYEERKVEDKSEWQKKFFDANPGLGSKHFNIWWFYYVANGRDEANKMFKVYREKEEHNRRRQENWQRQSKQAYDWQERVKDQYSRWYGGGSVYAPAVDHYANLGIMRTDSQEEVKAAYLRKALENHPDKGGNVEDMVRVNNAYDAIKKEQGWK